jgi:hypothetical protein
VAAEGRRDKDDRKKIVPVEKNAKIPIISATNTNRRKRPKYCSSRLRH